MRYLKNDVIMKQMLEMKKKTKTKPNNITTKKSIKFSVWTKKRKPLGIMLQEYDVKNTRV